MVLVAGTGALVLMVAGCGRGSSGEPVVAGSPSTSAELAPTGPSSSTAPTPSTVPGSSTSTTTATDASGEEDPSPVANLTPTDLRRVVEAPVATTLRSAPGPAADRVELSGGRTAWRVRIPGRFAVRAARAVVVVGDRTVGEAIVAVDTSALVAVTLDGTGLVAGAAVSYQWEGSEPVAVGGLEVAR